MSVDLLKWSRPMAFGLSVAFGAMVTSGASAAEPSLFAPEKAPESPAAEAAAPAAAREDVVMRIDVQLAEGDDPEAVYHDFFSEHQVHPKVVRAHVRRLMHDEDNDNRYAETIAVLNACLRTGQLQPWMYEALGLAMQLDNRPAEEIERVFMSSVDFSSNVNDKLLLAAYLKRIGRDARALQLFREVGNAYPTRPEPFAQALGIARRLNDVEGIQWATVGILRQVWPDDKQKLRQLAAYTAKDLILQLKEENRLDEARAYVAALNDAQKRDITVKLSWEGKADVDMMIEEPAGTVCSFRTPRTTAGGVMLGETASQMSKLKGEGNSETYVCPEGYEGTYRVLLRHIWGRIPSGKVTVEITRYDSNGEKFVRTGHYPVGAKDAMVVFDLENGRRNENLAEHQVAMAAQGQLAVNRAILAQQINALTDSDLQDLFESGGGSGYPIVNPFDPRFGRGAVGYRPELTILPEGANMTATAVISADRRYVRITARPLFSQITDVATFSVTGAADNSFGVIDNPNDPEPEP